MAESSRFWTTSGTGDGPGGGYSAANFNEFVRQTFMTNPATEGVLRGIGNDLVVSGTSSPVAVNTGAGLVYGFFYTSDSSVNVAIPTPTTATRIDRIVLRVSWAAQTVRITRIAGTEGGGAPALTQTANTTWDIPLAQVSITTGGVITVTDQRTYIKSPGVYNWINAALTVNGSVTAGLSASGTAVGIGATNTSNTAGSDARMSANVAGASGGDPHAYFGVGGASEWVAGVDNSDGDKFKIGRGGAVGANNDLVIDASGNITMGGTLTPNALGTNTVPTAAIVDGAVTTAKLPDGAVTLAKHAADSVDDTKVGDRVPQFYRRQGGSASDWSVQGTGAQTPGAVRMQAGVARISIAASPVAQSTITFPVAFSNKPLAFVSIVEAVSTTFIASVVSVSTTAITIQILHYENANATGSVDVNWLAIGPE
jgi:hypothetical protein